MNGPRGGTARQCHTVADLDGLGTVVVEHTDRDLYAAVDKAAGRLKRSVRRHINRRRDAKRSFVSR